MKRVVFVGQAMPKVKETAHHWPGLNSWLYSIDIKEEEIKNYFLYSALVDYFPGYHEKGGHKVPTKDEVENEKERLRKTITDFNPEILVTIGKLSLSYCLNQKIISLDKNYIGKSFKVNPYNLLNKEVLIIPLPHPSGASTWRYKEGNQTLLKKALTILKKELQ